MFDKRTAQGIQPPAKRKQTWNFRGLLYVRKFWWTEQVGGQDAKNSKRGGNATRYVRYGMLGFPGNYRVRERDHGNPQRQRFFSSFAYRRRQAFDRARKR